MGKCNLIQYITDETRNLKQTRKGLYDIATEQYFQDFRQWLAYYFQISLEDYKKLNNQNNIGGMSI